MCEKVMSGYLFEHMVSESAWLVFKIPQFPIPHYREKQAKVNTCLVIKDSLKRSIIATLQGHRLKRRRWRKIPAIPAVSKTQEGGRNGGCWDDTRTGRVNWSCWSIALWENDLEEKEPTWGHQINREICWRPWVEPPRRQQPRMLH